MLGPPLLVRLYRKKKKPHRAPGRHGKLEKKQTGAATEKQYRTRPQLAREMIQILAGWIPDRKLLLTADSEYAGRSISRHLPPNVELISRMTMKAALYAPAPENTTGRGRRRKKGKRLFSLRWPLEVCFRDVKQFLGFEDPQNRVSQATRRTAPLIFYIYDLVLLWHALSGHLVAQPPLHRLWYRQKSSVSFEDILRTQRYATWQEKIFGDPTLDAHTRKILQPFMEWAKMVA